MEEAIRDLKRCVKQYRTVDDELRRLNKAIFERRESRKIVEMEIADLMKIDGFRDFKKLKIEEDGSTITVRRPQEWSKPWTLSKEDLKELLDQYFATTSPVQSAERCFEFITEAQKRKLVSTDYSFSRIVPEED